MTTANSISLMVIFVLYKFACICDGATRGGGRRGVGGGGGRTSDVVYFKCALSEISYPTQVKRFYTNPTSVNSKIRCEGTVLVKACEGNCPSSEMWSIKRGLTRVCRCCDISSKQSINVMLRTCRDHTGRMLRGVARSAKVSVPTSCGCTKCSNSPSS